MGVCPAIPEIKNCRHCTRHDVVYFLPWIEHLDIQSVVACWKSHTETPQSTECRGRTYQRVSIQSVIGSDYTGDMRLTKCNEKAVQILICARHAFITHRRAVFNVHLFSQSALSLLIQVGMKYTRHWYKQIGTSDQFLAMELLQTKWSTLSCRPMLFSALRLFKHGLYDTCGWYEAQANLRNDHLVSQTSYHFSNPNVKALSATTLGSISGLLQPLMYLEIVCIHLLWFILMQNRSWNLKSRPKWQLTLGKHGSRLNPQ